MACAAHLCEQDKGVIRARPVCRSIGHGQPIGQLLWQLFNLASAHVQGLQLHKQNTDVIHTEFTESRTLHTMAL